MRPCALALCFDESNLRSPRDESMSSLARLVLDIEAQLVGRAVQTPRCWRPAMHHCPSLTRDNSLRSTPYTDDM